MQEGQIIQQQQQQQQQRKADRMRVGFPPREPSNVREWMNRR